MPVQVQWYEAPHVIATFCLGEMAAQDMDKLYTEVRTLMAEAKAPLYALVDVGKMTHPFMNMGELRSRLKGIMDDERIEWVLVYRVHLPIVTFLVSFLARTFALNMRTFESWEDVQAFLDNLDTGLDFSRIPTPSESNAQNQK